MAKDLLLPGSILSLHRSAVEKLLKAGNGDAALLYLCLTAGQNSGALPWGPDQVEAAQNTLLRLGLFRLFLRRLLLAMDLLVPLLLLFQHGLEIAVPFRLCGRLGRQRGHVQHLHLI